MTTTTNASNHGGGAAALVDQLRQAFEREAGLSQVDHSILSQCTLNGIDKTVDSIVSLTICFIAGAALALTLELSTQDIMETWEAYSLTKNQRSLDTHSFAGFRQRLIQSSHAMPDISSSTTTPAKTAVVAMEVTPPSENRRVSLESTTTSSSSPPAARYRYESRTGSGQVVLQYTATSYQKDTNNTNDTSDAIPAVEWKSVATNLVQPVRHMFCPPDQRARVLNQVLHDLGTQIMEQLSGNEDEMNDHAAVAPLEVVGVPRPEKITCVGRIVPAALSGEKMTPNTVQLEGLSESSWGARMQLQLPTTSGATTSSWSLFPGQIVAVQGYNPTGRSMMVHDVHDVGAVLPPDSSLSSSPLKMVVAAGPYTTTDRLDYAPLEDFLRLVLVTERPQVVILTGPFVDVNHPRLARGDTREKDNEPLLSFQEFFQQMILDRLADFLQDHANLQFVLVPSLDDATTEGV
jgi:DNA polymerase alpha/epsilon subunit B